MNEPEYIFVKGEGWVIRTSPIYYTRDRVPFRLEQRRPQVGERYYRDAFFDPRSFQSHASIFNWEPWGLWRESDYAREPPNSYYVLVKL